MIVRATMDMHAIYDTLRRMYAPTDTDEQMYGGLLMLDSTLRAKFPQGTLVHYPVSTDDTDPANSRVYMVNWNIVKDSGSAFLHSARVPISMHRKHVQFCDYKDIIIIADQDAAREKWSGANV